MDNRIKVFIVEDEALVAEEIRRVVEGLGYEVGDICYNYASAAVALPASDADLFLFDINLGGAPSQNGLALAGMLKETSPRPFIFLTAYSDKETIRQATALHPANYLIKPVNPAAMFAAIQLAIAQTQEPGSTAIAIPEEIPAFFYIKVGDRKEKLYWQDVYGMEASKNYIRLLLTSQSADYPLRGTMAFVLDQLMPKPLRDKFFRLGKSVCLNRAFVTWVSDEYIICGGRQFENAGRVSPAQFAIK